MTFLKKYRKRIAIVAVVLVAIWRITFPWPFPAARGRFAAHLDLAVGNYRIMRYGLSIADREYTGLLKQRYNIDSKRVAFCIVSRSLVDYADSYNEISEAAANKKFGRDVFSECFQEARKTWEKRRAELQTSEAPSR
jgi:hypothetical protein